MATATMALTVRVRGLWRLRLARCCVGRPMTERVATWALDRIRMEVRSGRRVISSRGINWTLRADGTIDVRWPQ